MGEFLVHHVRLFDFVPKAIHCLASDEDTQRLAVSRSDGSVEIWSAKDNWFQEKIIPGQEDQSVEALVWCQQRLFSGGLQGDITEYDLMQLSHKGTHLSNAGAVWCLVANSKQTHIAAGTEEGCIVIFELTEEGLVYDKALDRQEGRILSLAWHEGGEMMVSGGIDNIRIWSVQSGHAVQRLTLGRQDRNKDTIVWSIAVTQDFTIISGDSRGKTTFWNGKQGTALKSYQSHKADVLSVCASQDGTSVFASGVDPALAQFEYTAAQANSDWKMWVRSSVRNQHTHDVRAVTIAGDSVISGGVDCQLIVNKITKKKGNKRWRRIPPVPQSQQLVDVAPDANVVMFQYTDFLELWKLGSTNKTSDKDGEILQLKNNPVKLLQLKSKGNETIVTSAISSKANFVAYSDSDSIRLYQVSIVESEEITPQVSVQRLRDVPMSLLPAHVLCFARDGGLLISAASNGTIQYMSTDKLEAVTIQPPGKFAPIHLLAVSADQRFLATGDHDSNVHVYDLQKQKHHCSLPHADNQPTALSFHPDTGDLVVAYCDQKIVEFNTVDKEYTSWCRQLLSHLPSQWSRRHSKINHIAFNPKAPHQILLHDEQMLCILDKTQPFPSSDVNLYNKSTLHSQQQQKSKSGTLEHCFHMCTRYKYLMHVETVGDNYLVVVERTPSSMTEGLPPALVKHKFGT